MLFVLLISSGANYQVLMGVFAQVMASLQNNPPCFHCFVRLDWAQTA